MSVMRASVPGGHGDVPPRVRDQAREALVLMAFSAGVSVVATLLFLLAFGPGH
jgi:hypothetical protein